MYLWYQSIFWGILWHIPAHIQTLGKLGLEKTMFLAVSPTLGPPSVAQCCLNVDLYPSYDKHTSKLSIAPFPMSKKFLERFLAKKTSFFVFFKSQARFVAKWLNTHKSLTVQYEHKTKEDLIFRKDFPKRFSKFKICEMKNPVRRPPPY